MSTDRELWARAVAGDRDAFGVIFDRHARAVYNHLFRRTADWAEAEDLTSAVFLAAWRRRAEITLDRDSALPWLLGVANRSLANTHRRRAADVGGAPGDGPPAPARAERDRAVSGPGWTSRRRPRRWACRSGR